jgi:hypothetical protein
MFPRNSWTLFSKRELSHVLTFDDVNDKEPDDSNLGSQELSIGCEKGKRRTNNIYHDF